MQRLHNQKGAGSPGGMEELCSVLSTLAMAGISLINADESMQQRTPLMTACKDGYEPAVLALSASQPQQQAMKLCSPATLGWLSMSGAKRLCARDCLHVCAGCSCRLSRLTLYTTNRSFQSSRSDALGYLGSESACLEQLLTKWSLLTMNCSTSPGSAPFCPESS